MDRLGIRADTELYLNVVAGSISIFHPSNAALQLTHGLIVAFHVYSYLCVYVYVFVFDRQSDALECAWDNIRGEGSSLMVNKPTSDKFSLAFSSPPFHILILSRPCLTTSSHQRNDLFSSGWIFTSFGLAANFPFIRSARIVLPRRCFAVFISLPPPSLSLSLSLSLARSLARRVFSPPESMFSLSGGDSLNFFYETYFFFSNGMFDRDAS